MQEAIVNFYRWHIWWPKGLFSLTTFVPKVASFHGYQLWGMNLTIDNLKKCYVIVLNWCFICEKDGWACLVSSCSFDWWLERHLSLVLSLGVNWVMQRCLAPGEPESVGCIQEIFCIWWVWGKVGFLGFWSACMGIRIEPIFSTLVLLLFYFYFFFGVIVLNFFGWILDSLWI